MAKITVMRINKVKHEDIVAYVDFQINNVQFYDWTLIQDAGNDANLYMLAPLRKGIGHHAEVCKLTVKLNKSLLEEVNIAVREKYKAMLDGVVIDDPFK